MCRSVIQIDVFVQVDANWFKFQISSRYRIVCANKREAKGAIVWYLREIRSQSAKQGFGIRRDDPQLRERPHSLEVRRSNERDRAFEELVSLRRALIELVFVLMNRPMWSLLILV